MQEFMKENHISQSKWTLLERTIFLFA